MEHIDNPCGTLEKRNIRNFYIREAEKILPTMENLDTKQLLEEKISKYK